MEHADPQLGQTAHRAADRLQRLALRHEHECLVPRLPPLRSATSQPVDAWFRLQGPLGHLAVPGVPGGEQGVQCRSRGESAADLAHLGAARDRVARRERAHGVLQRQGGLPAIVVVQIDRSGDPGGQAADVVASCGAGARGQGRAAVETLGEILLLAELFGPQELEQAKEAVGVLLEWGRREQQQVAAEIRDGTDRPVGRVAGVTRRAAQVMRLVDDQQVDACLDRLPADVRVVPQTLQTEHDRAVGVEGIEAPAVVPLDVREALVVQQHEDLVVLAPQLAEPLHGQRLRGDDEHPLGATGAHQVVEDQAGLDGLAQADLVGQQPAHGVGARGALGHVELVGEQVDPAAEKRPQAVSLAQRRQVQRVQPQREGLEAGHLARGQPLGQRVSGIERPQLVQVDQPAVLQLCLPGLGQGFDDDHLPRGLVRRPQPGTERQRDDRVRTRREP